MTSDVRDEQVAAAAVALWRAFDYLLPADPGTVAMIALTAARKVLPTIR